MQTARTHYVLKFPDHIFASVSLTVTSWTICLLTRRYGKTNDDVSQVSRTKVGPVLGRRSRLRISIRRCRTAGADPRDRTAGRSPAWRGRELPGVPTGAAYSRSWPGPSVVPEHPPGKREL